MAEKFSLGFDLLSRDQIEASITGNPFIERNRLIVRLDMMARSDDLKAKLEAAPDWDLVICDEAHRMAASYFGGEVKETQRHKLGKLLGTRTRNLLLMSATPHNGKEADFQLLWGSSMPTASRADSGKETSPRASVPPVCPHRDYSLSAEIQERKKYN